MSSPSDLIERWSDHVLTTDEMQVLGEHVRSLDPLSVFQLWCKLAGVSKGSGPGSANIQAMHGYFGPKVVQSFHQLEVIFPQVGTKVINELMASPKEENG